MSSILQENRQKMGMKTFWKYVERLYRKIQLMHPGESLVIDDTVSEENKELFTELLKNFIYMHPGEYLFSNDYAKFIKQQADRLEEARKVREKLGRKTSTERDSAEA